MIIPNTNCSSLAKHTVVGHAIARLLMALITLSFSSINLADNVILKGPLAQGGYVIGHAPHATAVFLNDDALKLTQSGHFAFGFGREAPKNAALRVTFADNTEWRETLTIGQREYNIQYVTGVPQHTVTPHPDSLKRIRDEAARVRQARSKHYELEHFLETFIWPAQGRLTGVYGSQRYYNGEPRTPHYGVDVAAPTGSPVIAPAGGVVTLAHPDLYFSGGTLIIDHGYGISSTFMHLNALHVKEGDTVRQGQRIADIGQTGRATGPHLDWRMNWYNVRMDPQLFMPPLPNAAPAP